MRITKVKKTTKIEAMRFLKPALRELLKLNVGYKVDGWVITIQIPKFIPDPTQKDLL